MKLEEFNPPTPEIDLDGQIVSFGRFRLLDKAWSLAHFATKENPNGLEVLSQKLEALDILAAAELAWRLVENKREITKAKFFAFAEDPRNFSIIYKAIIQSLTDSEPTQENSARLSDLKKS